MVRLRSPTVEGGPRAESRGPERNRENRYEYILLRIQSKSYYHPIVSSIYSGKYDLPVSTPILLEYAETLQSVFPKELLEQFLLFILTSENVRFVSPTFHFQLPLADEDDWKFVDCAVCGNADFLITNDKHYNTLQNVGFPKVSVIKAKEIIEEFSMILRNEIIFAVSAKEVWLCGENGDRLRMTGQ
uniref:Predicted nucleic acid-binding protein, contains PIN domain n=1 Tax=Candidatus Kentrum sp. LFY TaxID=2126342 RepID=A0A450UR63_9GAMM|nr:MAG: Predicted nucleic acid-binding protein, contains PIN domain [Candidatus Kentron sp. LFY]